MDRRRPTIHSGERSGDVRYQRASALIGQCAQASPAALPALTEALVEYLLAGREASLDAPEAAVDSPRLRECGVVLDALLRQAEQTLRHGEETLRHSGLALGPTSGPPTRVDRLSAIADEAGHILADVRQVVRSLPSDRADAQRLRLAVVEAWGRYDDALTAARAGVDADLAVLANLRDALRHHLEAARSLLGASTSPAARGPEPGADGRD